MTEEEIWKLCEQLSFLSNCLKANVGSVIVRDGEILGTGFNHSVHPKGKCSECIRAGIHSGTRAEIGYCAHAEWIAVLTAMSYFSTGVIGSSCYIAGFRIKDGERIPFDYSEGFLCSICARLLKAAGIAYIVVPGKKFTIDEALETAVNRAGRI